MKKFLTLIENELDDMDPAMEPPAEEPGVEPAPPAPPPATPDAGSMAIGDIELAKQLALRTKGLTSADRMALSVEISDSNIDSIRQKLHDIANTFDTP